MEEIILVESAHTSFEESSSCPAKITVAHKGNNLDANRGFETIIQIQWTSSKSYAEFIAKKGFSFSPYVFFLL